MISAYWRSVLSYSPQAACFPANPVRRNVLLVCVGLLPIYTEINRVRSFQYGNTPDRMVRPQFQNKLPLYALMPVGSQVPVLNDVRDITLETHRGESVALISYENKAPPQLWKLEILRGGETGRESSRLTLRYALLFLIFAVPLTRHDCT